MDNYPNDDFDLLMRGLLNKSNPQVDDETCTALRRFMLHAARGNADNRSICTVLVALSGHRLDPALAETLVRVIEETAQTAQILDQDWNAVNIVGTGGGIASFNISSTAAILAAATGLRVLKSGSAAYSSAVGAIDFLRAARIPIAQNADYVHSALEQHGIAFYMPGTFSPLLKRFAIAAAPFRLKTMAPVLNRIGPMLRLLPSSGQLTGVACLSDLAWYADVFGRLGQQNIRLIANPLGLDEACSIGVNQLCSVGQDSITEIGSGLGFQAGDPKDLRGGDAYVNLEITRAILCGEGPIVARESVMLNAALLICTAAGPGEISQNDIAAALREVKCAITSGAAWSLFQALSTEQIAKVG